eukprot:TRINITY_DN1782_c0_g1_i1.p2 TRINITY_DN1782_c0_g1~~TRINITY_DN1782_c0_g1_i1.p2  ORF type:complete len:144 (+),score=9.93 TRINITY_DN1782_c0_g1_i1:1080-1511(+)
MSVQPPGTPCLKLTSKVETAGEQRSDVMERHVRASWRHYRSSCSTPGAGHELHQLPAGSIHLLTLTAATPVARDHLRDDENEAGKHALGYVMADEGAADGCQCAVEWFLCILCHSFWQMIARELHLTMTAPFASVTKFGTQDT